MNINRKGRILPIKDTGFSLEDNYPLLNETLYRSWPTGNEDEAAFSLADEILLKVQTAHKIGSDLG